MRATGASEETIARYAALVERGSGREQDSAEALWPEHVPAAQAFLACDSQWRTQSLGGGLAASSRLVFLGLDHTAVAASLTLAGLSLTPAQFADLRVIEGEAARLLNGGGRRT